MAAPASAADIAAKPYVKAPPPAPAPIYDWTGFYIGANGGWGQSHNCLDLFTDILGTVTGCNDRSGGLVGGQIGYRWQTNQFVFGLEAQGDWADLSNTRWGGAAGVGWEYGFGPNWSVGVEYDHLWMGNANNDFTVVRPLATLLSDRVSQDVDMVTVRFNYRFGGYGAPVAARY